MHCNSTKTNGTLTRGNNNNQYWIVNLYEYAFAFFPQILAMFVAMTLYCKIGSKRD